MTDTVCKAMPLREITHAASMSDQTSGVMFYRSMICFYEYWVAAMRDETSTTALNSISEQ